MILNHIKMDKSSWPNQVYPGTLRQAREEIVGDLAEIFVLLLATGELPEDLRMLCPNSRRAKRTGQRTAGE